MEVNERVLDFLDDCGFTPLCEVCEYEKRCSATDVSKCRKMKDIMKIWKKHFGEVK